MKELLRTCAYSRPCKAVCFVKYQTGTKQHRLTLGEVVSGDEPVASAPVRQRLAFAACCAMARVRATSSCR
jgi:hypothetical protein